MSVISKSTESGSGGASANDLQNVARTLIGAEAPEEESLLESFLPEEEATGEEGEATSTSSLSVFL